MTVSFSYSPDWTDTFSWTIYVGFFVCFLLAFGMGANDTANSYGTVVGAGVVKLWQAYLMATIFETLGAGLLGYKVTETIRGGIVDLHIYDVYSVKNGTPPAYKTVGNCTTVPDCTDCCAVYTDASLLFGELGALSGTAFWLISASLFKMPVSATQSVVGATVGFTLVLHGTEGIEWLALIKIVVSWVSSPLMAGFFSVVFYLIIKFTVFAKPDQLKASLISIPFWFWFTLAVNLFTVFYDGSKYLGFDKIPWWGAIIISVGIGLIVAILMWCFGNKWVEKRAIALYYQQKRQHAQEVFTEHDHKHHFGLRKGTVHLEQLDHEPRPGRTQTYRPNISSISEDLDRQRGYSLPATVSSGGIEMDLYPVPEQNGPNVPAVPAKKQTLLQKIRHPIEEDGKAVNVFNYLQIMSACFLAFSHGSNDTANSVGPLVSLFLTYKYGRATVEADSNPAMELIILYGAACSMIGLYVMGHKVIKTIGKDLTEVNAPSGFAMSVGTAFTVLFASKIGVPVSTTHCMVGAVLFVGMARSSSEGVSWKIFRNIAFAWLVTTPVAGLVSALVTYLLAHFIIGAV